MSPWSKKRWRTVLQLRQGALYLRIPADIAQYYHLRAGDRLYVLPPPPAELPEGEKPIVLVRFDLGGFGHGPLANDPRAVFESEISVG